MSILTDSDFVSAAMLTALDPEIPAVSQAEGITIEGDGSVCRQAWDECADTLQENMDSYGGYVNLMAGAGVQMATLLTNYGMGVARSRVWLSQIVTTDPYGNRTPVLQRWMAYAAATLFYREASNRRDHDRYQKKHDRFEEDRKARWRSLWVKGLPMIMQPLSCPGALHELNAGTFSASNVTTVVAGSDTGHAYDVVITWVDQSRYLSPISKGNAESGPSVKVTLAVAANHALSISIATLSPPNGNSYGTTTFADGVLNPLTATGWNVYVGVTGGTLYLQNTSPIPVGTSTYSLPGTPALGYPLQPGQYPDANYAFEHILPRA